MVKKIALFDDQRGKLRMALMFLQLGRDEAAIAALEQIADDAQRWRESQGIPAHVKVNEDGSWSDEGA